LYHPAGHYGSTYDQMAHFRGLLDDLALARTLPSPRSTYKVPPPRLAATVHTLLSRARSEDRRAVWKRNEQVALSFSNLFDEVDDLPVVLRWARFLDDDGSTRTELYWGLQARALRPSKQVRRRLAKAGHDPSSTYLLDLTVVQQTATYPFRRLNRKPYLLNAPSDEPALVLPVQSFVVRGDTGRYHLALQWDAYWAYQTAPDEAPTPGPRVKIGAYRIDTLRALSNDPGWLEMSDLKPLRVAGSVDELDTAPPYPHAVLTPEIGLALYFEVYHLTFGSDDQTHYSLAYEVARRKKGGLLRRDRTTLTSAQTRYTGQRRTAHETILLDWGEVKGARELEVIVRVTDETTGQMVERSLSFDVREE